MSMADATTVAAEVGSPSWWLIRLIDRLAIQAEAAEHLDAYYQGDQGIPVHANRAVSDAYRRLMTVAPTNFAMLIVEAVRERMVVGGFRTGAVNDPNGDAAAWAMWQANQLDADADMVHRAQLAMAAAYVIVGQDPETGEAVITPEDPRQVYAECDPVRRRTVRAAVKVFHDDLEDADRVFLYLPGRVYKARREAPAGAALPGDRPVMLDTTGWEWDAGTPEIVPTRRIPVVPFLNRTDLFGQPQGEFEGVLPILDRINYTILSRLEIATLQAFRQRAIKGLPAFGPDGTPIDYDDIFAADPGALWQLPETAEIWESGVVDLNPIRSAIRDDVEHLAAVSRMPVHYLEPVNESAEGVEAKREGLIFTCQDRCKQAGESWEQVMSIAFEIVGDEERANRADLEIIWNSVERSTLNERASAASQAMAGGLTWRTTMSDVWGFSPTKIARMEAERAAETIRDATMARLAQAGGPPAGPAAPPAAAEVEEPGGGG